MIKWAAEFKRGRENIGDDGRSDRPKEATADENAKVVHTLVICDIGRRRDLRSIASEVDIIFGAGQKNLTNILRCVKGFGKMDTQNVDR